jgi:hypothetical protein
MRRLCDHAATSGGELTDTIIDFVVGVGIRVSRTELDGDTFLPGIRVRAGGLDVDSPRLVYPGDILHEAGHLAVLPEPARSRFGDPGGESPTDMRRIELQAIAWSYAAALELGIDPAVVFHAGGYHGRSASLLGNFTLGVYVGLDDLARAGMVAPPREAARLGVAPYPHMLKWLND